MNKLIKPLAVGRPLLSSVKTNTGLYSDLGTPDEFLVAEVQGGRNPDSELGLYVRLFTAAPEMYELLRKILSSMNDDTDPHWVYGFINEIIEMLAKIEGGGDG